jgi:two-component system cell cycle sensor histidine kinase/response regulator CckA
MKILVVDDKEGGRYLLEVLLRAKGHDVHGASNGAEALERLAHGGFDLVITDVLMPVTDGFELCRRMRRDEALRQVPVIIYTATYTGPEDEKFALGVGADRFIQKPCEPDALIQAIEEVTKMAGRPPSAPPSPPEEAEALRLYSERLVRKLEQKALELEREVAARRRSEERYRLVVENAGEVIAIVRGDRFRFINRKATEIVGYWEEELLSRPFWEIVHPEDREKALDSYSKRLSGRATPEVYSFRVVGKGGDVRWAEINVMPIEYEGGPAVLCFLRDITDRKRAEEEVAQLQDQLRQAQKMEAMGRLAGGIAHDFNNLLTVIHGNAQLVAMELREGDPLKGLVDEIRDASMRASGLTRQLLAFSRRQPLEMRVVDLNGLLLGIEGMLRRIIGEDIEVVFRLQEGMGRIKADPGQLEHAVVNLAVNARDAMPQGGRLTVETADVELDEAYARTHLSVEPGPYVMLSVTDTGSGMTPEVKERLFEPFFTTKGPGRGTGLGLAAVYGMVKQSGGHIFVYSEPGHGTTFKIYLPRVEEPAQIAKGPLAERRLPSGSETVLVVEDDAAVRELAVRILKGLGYEVLEAASGEEALGVCKAHGGHIDLVLTDVVMPGMDGRVLVQSLKEVHPGAKAIFMSGYTDNVILHHGILEEGMNFIHKPFTVEGLGRKVREVLDK